MRGELDGRVRIRRGYVFRGARMACGWLESTCFVSLYVCVVRFGLYGTMVREVLVE